MPSATLRQKLGCWAHERWRAELVMRFPAIARMFGLSWLALRNRGERLSMDERTGGRVCEWQFSSTLVLPRVFPEAGSRLMQHCLRQWPIELAPEGPASLVAGAPVVSVIIGVRGTGRLEQFRACLAAVRAQEGVSFEVIVVEQSWKSEFASLVPAGVRYVHQQATDPAMPFNRSWALNRGAREAAGRILLLHDADMLLPKTALREITRTIDGGLDALRLPRLLFYLDEPTSAEVQAQGRIPRDAGFERIIANNRTPIAVTRDCYLAIGGHDEAFFGWGAEDDEFMDRLRTRQVGEGAFLPIVHLWHPSAAASSVRSRNEALLEMSRRRPIAERIEGLRERPFGTERPSIEWTSA